MRGAPNLIERLAQAVTGPRGRWVTLAVWVAIGAAGFLAHGRIGDLTAAGQSSFLPSGSESTRAVDALQHDFEGGEDVPAVIVFERGGGLTKPDLNAIGRIGAGLERLRLTGATPVIRPFSGETAGPLGDIARIAHGVGPISRDGEAALVVLALNAQDHGAVIRGVKRIRAYLAAHAEPGLQAYVTGPAGIAADLDLVASDASQTLLLATLALVLLLLLAVYRAPLLALLPLLTVGAAYMVATGIAYLLIEAGAITVNTEGTLLLLVLIFGAGTDYSLLLVHRYREELGRRRAPGEALSTALRESAPAIGASGGTVIAAMLVLLLANLESTRWLGPILAIGIAVMLAAAFTLLSALLALLGPRAFWSPRLRHDGPKSQNLPADGPKSQTRIDKSARRQPGFDFSARRGAWERVAGVVRRRSGRVVVGVFALLAVLALGNLTDHGTLGYGQGVTKATDSSRGTEALERHFPPGIGSPLTAIVAAGRANRVDAGLERLRSVQLVVPAPAPTASDRTVLVVILRDNPYSSLATDAVRGIRARLHQLDPSGLLGGIPVENYDVEQTNARDTRLIVPLVLLVVGIILVAVLRALVAPAYVILTVVASFAATIGLATFAFTEVFHTAGIAFNLVLATFIFLVALGVDYNIFLMTRAREEAAARGAREGMLAALVTTGGVVTSAGVILAGTFAALTLLPLEELIQIGATVAFGVLLDTFLVRALLVPAITYRLGERAWWPGRAGSGEPPA